MVYKSAVRVTAIGLTKLRKELEELKTKREAVRAQLADLRQQGDLAERAEHEVMVVDQYVTQHRINELENLLKRAHVVRQPKRRAGTIGLGSTIQVLIDGVDCEYTLVSSFESDPARGLISIEAPLGRALIGHRAGEAMSVNLPHGSLRVEVLGLRHSLLGQLEISPVGS